MKLENQIIFRIQSGKISITFLMTYNNTWLYWFQKVILLKLGRLGYNIICLSSFIINNSLFHLILMLYHNIVDWLIIWFYSFSHLIFLDSLWIIFQNFIDLRMNSWFRDGRSFLFLLINYWYLVFAYTLRSSFVKNFWHFIFAFTIFNVVIHFIKILRNFFVSSIFRAYTSAFRIQITNKPIFWLQNHIFPGNRLIFTVVQALILILEHNQTTRIDTFSLNLDLFSPS